MEKKVTFCRICEASCGLIADVEGNRVVALHPDPEHVVSRGFACIKGIHYTAVHESPDRVQTPLKRVGDRFEPISWDQAFKEIGEKVRAIRAKHGRDSVGGYIGNPAAFNLPHFAFAGMFFMKALRTKQLYTAGSQDCNNKFVAAEEMFGSPLLQPVPDLDRLQCFIVVGANPGVSQMTFINAPRVAERLKDICARDGQVFFVNPRKTESAAAVGEQVFIRPGSDVFFFLAFANELFARNALHAPTLQHVSNLSELRAVVERWPAERSAALTGISVERLQSMVTAYLRADGAALYAGTGVNQGPHGTLCLWLLHSINVLSGNFDRRGGMMMTAQQRRMAKLQPPSKRPKYSRIGNYRAVMDSAPAAVLADEIETPGEGQLRAMFVTAGNPLLSCPNGGGRLTRAFEKLELLVCIDMFRNETGELAHYVLPTPTFLERSDMPLGTIGYQPVPYLQWSDRVVEPKGDVREEWWIFASLAQACGTPLMGSRAFTRYLTMSAGAKALPRMLRFSQERVFTMLALMERRAFWDLRKNPHGILLREPRGGTFLGHAATADGKIDLAPKRFIETAQGLDAEFEQQRSAGAKLHLITKRERNSHNSWLHNVKRFVDGKRDSNYLYMNPEDAGARGLSDGARCRVQSPGGVVEVQVKVSTEMMPGAVALPHGWGHQSASGLSVASKTRGVNANLLAPYAIEALSGMSRLTALEVDVQPTDEVRSYAPAE